MRQLHPDQTPIADDPVRLQKDTYVAIDARAKGVMKFIYSEENATHLLSFTDYSDQLVNQRVFEDKRAFRAYLSAREDVDTWEVIIEAENNSLSDKLIYFHQEPFGDIEVFNSEYELNRVLSKEGRGRWITEYVGSSSTELKRVGMIDNSSWWETVFTAFITESNFQKASQKHEQEQASWSQTLSWGMLGLLLGKLILPFFNNSSSQQNHEESDDKTEVEEESLAYSESLETCFSRAPESNFLESILPTSSMIQKAGYLALSCSLSWQSRGVSTPASATLGLFGVFMGLMPGSRLGISMR